MRPQVNSSGAIINNLFLVAIMGYHGHLEMLLPKGSQYRVVNTYKGRLTKPEQANIASIRHPSRSKQGCKVPALKPLTVI